ncbi:MAG TPA: MBL fold metallo-hydrolase [Vicinamibacterales bacterium]
MSLSRRDFLRLAGAATIARSSGAASRLILLGTAGGPTPKVRAAAPAQIIVIGDRGYLVDCGNGVARQMTLAGVFRTLRHVFITHHHSDHNADYGTLLLLEWGDQMKTAVDTWGPPPLARMTKLFLEMSRADVEVRMRDEGRPPLAPLIHPHEIVKGGFVMSDDRVRVTCAVVRHPLVPIALAYRFDCGDRSIVISGDTAPSDALVALARGADILVHEALWVPGAPGAPGSPLRTHILNSHTPVEDAGRIAARAGVATLVLSHIVPTDSAPPDEELRAAARSTFGGRIVVGKDLMEL